MKLKSLICVTGCFILSATSFAGDTKCSDWLNSAYRTSVIASAFPIIGWGYGVLYASSIDSMRRDAKKLNAAFILSNKDQYTDSQFTNAEAVIARFYRELTSGTLSLLRQEELIDFMLDYDSSAVELSLCRVNKSLHGEDPPFSIDLSLKLMLLSQFGGNGTVFSSNEYGGTGFLPEESIEWYRNKVIVHERQKEEQRTLERQLRAAEEFRNEFVDLR